METSPRYIAGFNISGKKGFQITFDNGWTASVQFGPGNYCHNKDADGMEVRSDVDFDIAAPDCPDAEVAAFASDGSQERHWHQFSADTDDTVKGWVSPSEVVEFLQLVEGFEIWKEESA